MIKRRRRVKHELTLQDRIITWAEAIRNQAKALPPGAEREMLLKKVQQAETATHLNDLALPLK